MELTLQRTKLSEKATLGALFVDSAFECYTLEDVVRIGNTNLPDDEQVKIQDETAIPAGRYRVIINMSPRLQKMMMRLLDVPQFDGILIHSGNTDIDTKGCILVGQEVVNDDYIHGGKVVLPVLQDKVQQAIDSGEEVWINITNNFLD